MHIHGALQDGPRERARPAGTAGMVSLVRSAVSGCVENAAGAAAAAISFYTAFSLAPMLVIAVGLAGVLYGDARSRTEVVNRFSSMIGAKGGEFVGGLIDNASGSRVGVPATIVGVCLLIIAAGGAFGHLKQSLDRVWQVRPGPGRGMSRFIRRRLMSFALVFVFAVLLVLLLAFSTLLALLGEWAGGTAVTLYLLNTAVSFVVVTLLVALMLRYLPASDVKWRDVWMGATVTSALFTVSNLLIGQYLGRATPASVYGAAGSVTILLIWLYCSSLTLLFGAELSRARAATRTEAELGSVV